MTGIGRIAVVAGLGINCCAYAQGASQNDYKNVFCIQDQSIALQIQLLANFFEFLFVQTKRKTQKTHSQKKSCYTSDT
ncbi:hypothetical protein BpHYR1_022818 [Brachionus plicatilis]|uniref:Secreted protein n=1 Tax=Brachionus plicatilis TaxID=10195 RepID=A0A3M7PFR5_BRAPC|nr:hypothetical protein BpHYR1_022818 [Brachionus plicatilis]